jgi:hypothetical protein
MTWGAGCRRSCFQTRTSRVSGETGALARLSYGPGGGQSDREDSNLRPPPPQG